MTVKRIKILYILNVANRFNNFSYSSYLAAKALGYEFHIAGCWTGYNDIKDLEEDEKKYGIKIHQIDFIRSPYDLRNLKAYRQVSNLVKEEQYDIIHCNTPIGGVIGRIVGKNCKTKKVIYQAHGFHFYKGAPFINWALYYPIERMLAKMTDVIITINKEDFQRAKRFQLRNNGKVFYIPGVGLDRSQYNLSNFDKRIKRNELGIPNDAIVIASVGELNKNKNNKVIIDALKEIHDKNIYYIICGEGPLRNKLESSAKEINVKFLGYRTDVKELLASSDIYVLPSLREGLSRSLMEAMTIGLPCIVSDIRGSKDLISSDGGIKCKNKVHDYVKAICELANNPNKRNTMGIKNRQASGKLDLEVITDEYIRVYRELF